MRHFAGDVTYRGDGLIAKNKDALFAELPALMRTSASPFVRALFADRPAKGGGGGGGGGGDEAGGGRRRGGGGGQKAAQNVSVGAQFRASMSELISTLQGIPLPNPYPTRNPNPTTALTPHPSPKLH